MSDCLFCKILNGDIPSKKVFENENVYAFADIQPLAKEHYLFIHRNHSKNVNEMEPKDITDIFAAIKEFTQSNKLEEEGFRVVSNINDHGCQSVFHTHFHVLGGEQLKGFGS